MESANSQDNKLPLVTGAEPVPKGRVHGIDLVRVFLASWILIHHYAKVVKYAKVESTDFIRLGFFGVECFFVLSGFVLAYVNMDRFKTTTPKLFWRAYFKFIVNRFFRIWPLHALITLIFYLTENRCTGAQFVKNITFTHFLEFGSFANCNSPSWFLHEEWYLSLLLPFILLAINLNQYNILFVGSTVFVLLILYLTVTVPIPDVYLSSIIVRAPTGFGIGLLMACLFHVYNKRSYWFDLATGIVLLAGGLWLSQTMLQCWQFFLTSFLLIAALVYCISRSKLFNSVADNPAIALWAEWSFSIYLIHFGLMKALKPLFGTENEEISKPSTFWVFVSVNYMMTLPLAILGYYLIEERARTGAKLIIDRQLSESRKGE